MGLDLTEFLTNCATSLYCRDDIYEARYDGFAMIAELNFGDLKTATTPSSNGFFQSCIEINTDHYSCLSIFMTSASSDYHFGGYSSSYINENSDIVGNDTYGMIFNLDIASLNGSDNYTYKYNGYGFDAYSFFTDSYSDGADAFDAQNVFTRFLAVDLPRFTSGDTVSATSAGAKDFPDFEDPEINDYVLANAMNFALTAAGLATTFVIFM